MGDPAGIGPEVVVKSMASPEIRDLAIFTIIGDEGVIKKAAKGLPPEVNILDPGPPLKDVSPGRPTGEGAKKALKCVSTAAEIMKKSGDKTPKAMVTSPVSKELIAGFHKGFRGHTEFLQDACSAEFVTMVLIGKNLCVVPVTRHIPISEVPKALNKKLIVDTLRQVVGSSRFLSGNDPARIAVAALNPHCGEGGKVGTEEIDIIAPAVDEAKKFHEHIKGPISADAVFYMALKKKVDIVVAMYHDQCLAPFKMVDFDNGVNLTLGLDWIRTSPDHGTAFDIAGKGVADPESMERAIKLAFQAIS
jgi:4-hydroxythreonine-4-phosphate dehydrogenase